MELGLQKGISEAGSFVLATNMFVGLPPIHNACSVPTACTPPCKGGMGGTTAPAPPVVLVPPVPPVVPVPPVPPVVPVPPADDDILRQS